MTEPLYYRPGEVAAILGKSVNTVIRWLNDGKIPGEKVGGLWFVDKAQLAEWRTPKVVVRCVERR